MLNREAIGLFPRHDPYLSASLNNLACDLCTRFKHLGAIQDLNEAVVLSQEALDLHPRGHPLRSSSLINLALCLSTRFKKLGEIQDLNNAIVLDREAIGLLPRCHPDLSAYLTNIAADLYTLYEQLGRMQDLNEAVVFGREAYELRPAGHPSRFTSLINLALCLSIRYMQLGEMQDLNDAIVLGRDALEKGTLIGQWLWTTLRLISAFGSSSSGQCKISTEPLPLPEYELRPAGHPSRSTSLINLALCLSTQFDELGEMQDLDEAIVFDREASDSLPERHLDRSKALNNFAGNLYTRYKQLLILCLL